MTENEVKLYGYWCPKGYWKLDLLGKGGAAIVYLCEKSEGEFYAVKQFPKRSSRSWKNEIDVQSLIMDTL